MFNSGPAFERRIAELSRARRELLERMLRVPRWRVPEIVSSPTSGPRPLSFAQERMWILDRLTQDFPSYNETTVFRLPLDLDVPALSRSLNDVVRRHEILRTRFEERDGERVQVIAPELQVALRCVDASGIPKQETLEMIRTDARQLFQLSQLPLFRALLLRLGDEYLFAVTMHHIICDLWSLKVFAQDLMALYHAIPLPDLKIQYRDFAEWQRGWLQGDILNTQLSYWKTQLAELSLLRLPSDKIRPAVQRFEGKREPVSIPASLVSRLNALSQHEGVTLFMTVLAAFQTLLHRFTGQEDIALGVAVANRRPRETEALIGYFANTLVLRTDFSGDPTFRELLTRVRDVALSAYEYQDVPFERVVKELHPIRDLSRNPLFQVAFQLFTPPRLHGPSPEQMPPMEQFDIGTSKVDLRLDLTELSEGLQGYFEYNSDLFKRDAVAAMKRRFRVLLESIVAGPEQHISRLPLMDVPDRHRVLYGPFVHELFERQDPERVAIVSGDHRVTYGQLNRRANHLAHQLKKQNLQPETLVGLRMHRSIDMIAGLLGIWKAGCACLPLDAAYPAQRLREILDDARPPVSITELPPGESDENPEAGGGLAYVIYTSGSTGVPKGVAVEHRGLANVAREQARWFGVGSESRVLQFASLSFDASIFEIVMALTTGATLVMATRTALMDTLRDHRVTVATLSPSILSAMEPEPLPDLAVLNLAGERVTPQLAARWSAANRRLFNLYGPTECTIWATGAEITDVVSIGKPIANLRAYVLDRYLEPVPDGVPGELCISGIGVARGYLNRPDLTAERFLPDPFGEGRLYRTGDLVRYRSSGDLEFLGRLDRQVKVRGFRIEPGEVEKALNEHPSVGESVVEARDDTLIAYVVPRSTEASQWERQQVARWSAIHDQTYAASRSVDPVFDIVGWNSSVTGQPITGEEMHEHVDRAVERILRLRPKRVLEIGCGTGLLLFRIAPHCVDYLGTDFSSAALDCVRRVALPQVRLMQAEADSPIPEGPFDTVIINSVVQYFPSIEYLVRVLGKAARAVSDGGHIFIGDVRSLPLLESFLSWVEHQGGIRRRREVELVIDPDFFESVRASIPRIVRSEILPKSGRFQNELTLFRYDVVLNVAATDEEAHAPSKPWNSYANNPRHNGSWTSAVREYLRQRLPEYLLPSTILALDALPLTPSGKLDRNALPSPEPRQVDGSFVAPVTENERKIATVWQEVLGLDRVGTNDNFFDLGGHSLLMVRVHTRLRHIFGELSLMDLFQYPTVTALAKFVLSHQDAQSRSTGA